MFSGLGPLARDADGAEEATNFHSFLGPYISSCGRLLAGLGPLAAFGGPCGPAGCAARRCALGDAPAPAGPGGRHLGTPAASPRASGLSAQAEAAEATLIWTVRAERADSPARRGAQAACPGGLRSLPRLSGGARFVRQGRRNRRTNGTCFRPCRPKTHIRPRRKSSVLFGMAVPNKHVFGGAAVAPDIGPGRETGRMTGPPLAENRTGGLPRCGA